jgi:hypothetical protein
MIDLRRYHMTCLAGITHTGMLHIDRISGIVMAALGDHTMTPFCLCEFVWKNFAWRKSYTEVFVLGCKRYFRMEMINVIEVIWALDIPSSRIWRLELVWMLESDSVIPKYRSDLVDLEWMGRWLSDVGAEFATWKGGGSE